MINRDKIYTYFAKYHGPIIPSTNGWYSCKCPFCGRYKFAVHFDYLIGKCWRSCFRGFLVDMIQDYHGLNHFETIEFIDSIESGLTKIPITINKVKKSELILPVGYTPILSGDTIMGNRARKYLKGRGFDLNYMDRIGIGYCIKEAKDPEDNFFGYIIIPFKRDGLLIYFIGRDFIGNWKRYKNPKKEKYEIGKSGIFFNEEALYLENKIYITEGWSDACTIGSQGISIQGATPSIVQRNIVLKSDVLEIIIVPDAGFYYKGLENAKHFIGGKHFVEDKKIKVLNLDKFVKKGKDVNELGLKLIKEIEINTDYLDTRYLN